MKKMFLIMGVIALFTLVACNTKEVTEEEVDAVVIEQVDDTLQIDAVVETPVEAEEVVVE